MVSLRSGSRKQTLLQVETELFDLFIQGKPYHPTVDKLELHRVSDEEWVDATLLLSSPMGLPIQAQVFSPVAGGLVEYGPEHVQPCFYEHQSYEVVIQRKNTDKTLEFFHENPLLRDSIRQFGSGHDLFGTLNFQNEVGYTDFEVRAAGETLLQVRLEVFPSKIDYRRDYENILADVNELVYNLAFDFLRKTYNLTGLTKEQKRDQSLTEFYAILQAWFGQLVQAVERIEKFPHHRLQKENRVMDADRVKRGGKENLAYLRKRPHLLVKDEQHGFIGIDGQQYRPTKLLETKKRVDYDTAENRFLRFVLQRIDSKLKEMKKRLVEGKQKRYRNEKRDKLTAEMSRKFERMQAQVGRLLRFDFLQDVGDMRQMSVTLVLQMAPGYREVYRLYLMLLKGLSLQGDLFKLSLKDVAQLYEYWCFLKIHALLRKKYQLVSQDIVRVNRNGLFVSLDKTQKARVTYRDPERDEKFTLCYNTTPPHTREKVTVGQSPDNVLSLEKHDARDKSDTKVYNYVFDAKYRLNPAYEGTQYASEYKTPGPEVDDINTMHRYRDAVVYQSRETGEFERTMYGAYVLFPYHQEEEFEGHTFYKSIKKVNVGALPFLPNSTRLMEEFLDELILDSPQRAFERSTQPRGAVEYYEEKLVPNKVLIGALGSVEQLDVCLQHRFYHMPLTNLKEHSELSHVGYIGIYQSKSLFGQQAGIRYVARIRKWSVMPRKEIREMPTRDLKNADKLYVRFELEDWETIPVIVPNGTYVRTCKVTSKELLLKAHEIAELSLETEEELND